MAKRINNKKPLGYTEVGPKEKRKRLDRQNKDYHQGEYTVHYAWIHFMLYQESKNLAKETIDYYERFYKKFISFGKPKEGQKPEDANMGDAPANILASDAIRAAFVSFLKNQTPKLNEHTINSYLRAYRAFGNFCENEGYIEGFKCPITNVEAPLREVYTEKELKALLVRPDINNLTEFRDYTIINLILSTGARSKTILNLKLSDYDFETGYIRFNTTKAHRVVNEGLDPSTNKIIEEYIKRWRSFEETKPDDYIFCNVYGNQMSRGGLARSIALYNKSRGVSKTSLHLFRHTFAKMWLQHGGDIVTLARVLTHSELEMVKRYANYYDTDVKEAIIKHSPISQLRVNSGKTLGKRTKKDS